MSLADNLLNSIKHKVQLSLVGKSSVNAGIWSKVPKNQRTLKFQGILEIFHPVPQLSASALQKKKFQGSECM